MPDDSPENDLSLPAGALRCLCRPAAGAGVEELHLDRAAVPSSLRGVRAALRAWAGRIGLDTATTDRVVLAVDEAAANVVDHAFPTRPGGEVYPVVEPSPDGEGRRIVLHAAGRPCRAGFAISVSDNGSWRPPPPDPGHRGRGVALIGRLAERSTITTTESGTTTLMCWALP